MPNRIKYHDSNSRQEISWFGGALYDLSVVLLLNRWNEHDLLQDIPSVLLPLQRHIEDSPLLNKNTSSGFIKAWAVFNYLRQSLKKCSCRRATTPSLEQMWTCKKICSEKYTVLVFFLLNVQMSMTHWGNLLLFPEVCASLSSSNCTEKRTIAVVTT